jgi:hypothetical protein
MQFFTSLNQFLLDWGLGLELGDNCIVFENFMASIGDLMVAN